MKQQTSRLWTSVSGLNRSLVHQDGVLASVQKNQAQVSSRIKAFNSSLSQVLKDLQSLSEPSGPGEPAPPSAPSWWGSPLPGCLDT